MKLHGNWKKMMATTIISDIENKRRKRELKKENYSVSISSKAIFNDLKLVFCEIDGFRTLYIKLFEDMALFDFINTSSVTDKKDSMVSKHGITKLYEHTFNTFNAMVKLLKGSEHYRVQKDIFYLIALLHDFGKSHALCDDYLINLKDQHHIRSAKYFKKIIEDEENRFGIDETSFKIILKTLSEHHSLVSENSEDSDVKEDTVYMAFLKKADGMARNLEKEKIKNDS